MYKRQDSKKVAGTLSKRLAEMWKASSEKAALKSGESSPPSAPETDEVAEAPTVVAVKSEETIMLDLGEGEVECSIQNGNELWSNGKHIGNKSGDDEYEILPGGFLGH